MPDNLVRVVDETGKEVWARPEQMEALSSVGFRPVEGGTGQDERIKEEENERVYGDRPVDAFVEGALQGATLGLAPQDAISDQIASRNRGASIAGNITGSVLPSLMPGGVLGFTPAGLAARAGTAVERAAGGGVLAAAAGAATETALAVGVSSAVRADPDTVENLLVGAGLGAILGAGGAALSRGAIKTAARLESGAKSARAALSDMDEVKSAADEVKAAITAARKEAIPSPREIAAIRNEVQAAARETVELAVKQRDALPLGQGFRVRGQQVQQIDDAITSLRTAMRSASRTDEGVVPLADAIASVRRSIGAPPIADDTTAAIGRLQRAQGAEPPEVASKLLAGDPLSWASRKSTVEALEKLSGPQADVARAGVDRIARAIGVEPGGSIGETLKAIAEVKKAAPAVKVGMGWGGRIKSAVRGVAGNVAGRAAGYGVQGVLARHAAYAGLGYVLAGENGAALAGAMGGMRAGVANRVAQLIAATGPKIAKGMRLSASPLGLSLTGQWDADTPNVPRSKLAMRRMEELRQYAPVARDLAYTASAVTETVAPGLSVGITEKVGELVDRLAQLAPKDPMTEGTFFQSDWEPTPQELDVFEDVYQATTDPLGAIERGIDEGVTPELAATLQEIYPGLVDQVRIGLMMDAARLQRDLDLEARCALSILVGMPVDPLCSPEAIAFFQSAFVPQETPPNANVSSPNSGGRPPATSATSAQTATER